MNCSFCGSTARQGTGFTLFKKDGTPLFYCSKKCEKNALLKRNPRQLRWTERYASAKAASRKQASSQAQKAKA